MRRLFLSSAVTLSMLASAGVAYATHSWGPYHWARTSNPFTLKLGDNVSTTWDAYLGEASTDWSVSSVLDTTVVTGSAKPQNCKPKLGRTEVCSAKYGFNGWLGLAQIWINSAGHIVQGAAKLNDTYFNTTTYNTPAWRRLVMCQEVAHTFGLDHQDEVFGNPNLGTCMDYTSNPAGPPSNEHPNAHDYEQLELIYAHLDSSTTIGASVPSGNGGGKGNGNGGESDGPGPQGWGKALRKDGKGRDAHFERDLGKGNKVFTFVFWAD